MKKIIIAVVGMAGSGKTEVREYLVQKGLPYVRFGQAADDFLKEHNLLQTAENERQAREKLRQEYGMEAFAKKSLPKILQKLEQNKVVVIDGLYSWEEYIYLNKQGFEIILLTIYARPDVRYARLSKRAERAFTPDEARKRDIHELEVIRKGAPIAFADYLIENNNTSLKDLHAKIDEFLKTYDLS